MVAKRLLIVVLSVLCLLPLAACKRRVYVENCSTPNNVCVSGGVAISFSTADPFDAYRLVITREVDPNDLAYQGGAASGVVTVTLNNGSTVTYSDGLVYSSSESGAIPPVTSGYRVYAFVPADKAGLQAFIDRYKSQATSVDVDTVVALADISDGTQQSTPVDVQGKDRGTRDYIGTVSASLPRGDRGPIEY
jgi:hypothetical protein